MGRGAQVDIVPAYGAPDAIVGPLREAAKMFANAAGDKHAYLINRSIIVGAVMRRRRLGLVARGVDEGCNRHRGNRIGEIRPRPHRVTLKLELSAEGCELGTETTDMASDTRLSGLFGKTGYRIGTAGGS